MHSLVIAALLTLASASGYEKLKDEDSGPSLYDRLTGDEPIIKGGWWDSIHMRWNLPGGTTYNGPDKFQSAHMFDYAAGEGTCDKDYTNDRGQSTEGYGNFNPENGRCSVCEQDTYNPRLNVVQTLVQPIRHFWNFAVEQEKVGARFYKCAPCGKGYFTLETKSTKCTSCLTGKALCQWLIDNPVITPGSWGLQTDVNHIVGRCVDTKLTKVYKAATKKGPLVWGGYFKGCIESPSK